MRMRDTFTAAAAVLTIALAGCATATPESGDTMNGAGGTGTTDIRGEWELVSAAVGGESIELSPFPITMEFLGENARIRTGCFSFDQPLSSDLDVMTLAAFSDPLASCLAPTEGENAVFESLDDLNSAERTGDLLTLMGENVELELELVPAVELEQLVGTWQLGTVTMGDVAMGYEGMPALTINADGTISGSTGCADFSGTLDGIVSGTNTITDLEIGECADAADSADADVRAVLEDGFLIHMSENEGEIGADVGLSLISSTMEKTLVYHPAA